MAEEIIYKDFDIRFLAHPITGKLSVKKNTESVKQGLKNLIFTTLGERQYQPSFGSEIKSQLFENYTSFTKSNIEAAIKTAIKNYEQRIELIGITFGGDPDKNSLEVSIIFRVINSTETQTLNLNLEVVR